jgi:protein Tex
MVELESRIAGELSLSVKQVQAAVTLLEDGGTVPFIARYRKEATGGLDEVQIINIRDRLAGLKELEKRRSAILRSLTEQDVLTPELEGFVKKAESLSVLEDLYLPYRPKKRTRAVIAREKGLEPLSDFILADKGDPKTEVEKYIDPEKGLDSIDTVMQGARDIIAEGINENAEIRSSLRNLFMKEAALFSTVIKKKEKLAGKYKDYFAFSEPARRSPSHRILAVFRGVNEGFLTMHIRPDPDAAFDIIKRKVLIGVKQPDCREQIEKAAADGYARLLAPSLETEMKNELKNRADREAIDVFADNVNELLMAPPMGEKATIAIDPGQRTGCKVVCLDAQGKLLHYEAIFPLPPHNREAESAERIAHLKEKYKVEAIAIGNGTGGRETFAFCESIDFSSKPLILSVNENGASVYSASDTARREFPEHDVTVRGAVSIGRRLMDPLSELVKIDPKSIGVGQYQHDVDQKELKKSLDDVVTGCVNRVGVELNSASRELLSYVAGLGKKAAGSIITHREKNGIFSRRQDLLKVAGLGEKTYEQAVGFLRIRGAKNPLDASAVHPERYKIVSRMAADLGCSIPELMSNQELQKKLDLKRYVDRDVGLPTLKDILDELAKPGRDPRSTFEVFRFSDEVHQISDLKENMVLPGIITNVTRFGAFVDIGVHQDGLVHISQLSNEYVQDPGQVVKVQQQVMVKVLSIDMERKRIGLSMKDAE